MDGQTYSYRHSGLRVDSVLELPEWAAFACEAGDADVRITVARSLGMPVPEGEGADYAGDCLRFSIPGIGGWEIEGGHSIRLHPGLTTAPRELRLFTLGSAWGALGYQRGLAFWHGSAVARGGRAVLFAGAQEAGKSTMAAAMLARGAGLVSDDLARIDPEPAGARIHRASTRSKLWQGAIAHLGWQDRVRMRDYFRDDKFHCDPQSLFEGETAPLAAIVLLAEGPQVTLERIEGAQAVPQAMAATLYRAEFLDAMDAWPQQTALAARIASKVPVYRLTRPKDFAQIGASCDAAESLF